MKLFNVEQTEKSPKVVLDCENNMFLLKGTSITNDAEEFYKPIIDWLEEYKNSNDKPLVFDFELDFFNIRSSRKILRVLYKLEELCEKGIDVTVRWNSASEKDHIHEAGEDYSCMVNVPFEFSQRTFPSSTKELVNF